jgi:cobyrinic acid a,c-diamide synthase
MERPKRKTETPVVVIGGSSSGVGKTIVSMAIMFHLSRMGYKVQPFKVGPDYIDPSYHEVVCNRPSYNLDVWLMGKKGVLKRYSEATSNADVAVIEGVMGLFDGVSGRSDFGSTAHVARLLNAPVVLVVDAGKTGGSIAALIFGFANFEKKLSVSGVVLNNIASPRHLRIIREAIRGRVDVPIVGVITRHRILELKERHLGLIPVLENQRSAKKKIISASQMVSKGIFFDMFKHLGVRKSSSLFPMSSCKSHKRKVKIAIAKDESFNFYYADTIDSLERNGAQVVYFSPVKDNKLPEGASGIVLGGGFPEILGGELEKNHYMKKEIIQAAHNGMPIYAECGGLMYLTRNLTAYKNGKMKKSKMVGLIDANTIMGHSLTLGYTEAENRCHFFRGIKKIRGHEFHYSQIIDIAKDLKFAYILKRGNGIFDKKDGFVVYNCLASYMHLHFGGDQRIARRIVELGRSYLRR